MNCFLGSMRGNMFITFTRNETHYFDNIRNGFFMSRHEVRFNPNILNIIEKSIEMWNACNFQMELIREIRELHNTNGGFTDNFFTKLHQLLASDSELSIKLGFLFQQARAEIKMKCFTEIRENQKLSRYHCIAFGEYGILMKRDWMVKVGGSPVIYADRDHSLIRILARNQAMLSIFESHYQTSTRSRTFSSIGCFIDILSFLQEPGHFGEYEWRVVSKSDIGPFSFFPSRDRVQFEIGDIHSFFVPDEEAKYRLMQHLSDIFAGETNLPKIYLTNEIILSEDDERMIASLTTRNI